MEEVKAQIKELFLLLLRQTWGNNTTLHCADIEPGEITEQKIAMIDYERNAGQKRKSSVEFK